MYPIWLLCLSNLKRRKIQNGFIALIILLAALLFSTAVAVINNTGSLYTNFHDQVQGSHQILKFEENLHNPVQVRSWWEQQKGIKVSELLPYRNMTGFVHDNKEYPNFDLMMVDTPAKPFVVDRLVFAQGDEKSEPAAGTVWLPTSLAYSKQIAVGDTLEFKKDAKSFRLKVSAVVIDVPYSSPFTTTGRIWMNHTDFERNLPVMQGTDMYMLGLRFNHYTENAAYWKAFEQDLGSPYLEKATKFEGLSSFYMVTNKLIGFIMIFLAVVMIMVALYTVGFTISDAVLSNYKTIGILKSQGFTSIRTTGIYVMQYAVLAVVSILPGIALSYPFSQLIVAKSLAYLRSDSMGLSIRFANSALAVGFSILAVVIFSALVFSYRTRFVQPVQAIRYGMSERDSAKQAGRVAGPGSRLLGFSLLPAVWVIGLRGMIRNRAGSVLMAMIAAATSAVLVFGLIFVYSIVSINQTISLWGYDSSDISMRIDDKSKLTDDELKRTVFTDPRIKNYSRFGETNGVIPVMGSAEGESLNIVVTVVEGNYDTIGVSNLKGRNPHKGDEIAVGVNVAKKLNKDIGDPIDVYVQGQKKRMTVTGIYQAIANLSYSARICAEALTGGQQSFGNMDSYFVNLMEPTNPDGFVKELSGRYGGALWSATHESLVNEVFVQAVAVLVVPMSVIGLLFLIVTFVIIFSICRINIRKEQKNYGIYKSIGMTSRKIRFSISSGILSLSIAGTLAGIPVGIYLLPKLLDFVLSDYGIVKMPLVIHWGNIAAAALLSVLSAAAGSWMASKTIKQTSPRILTVE